MQQEVYQFVKTFAITFGGMCSWRRVAVARVFALVVRCRVMMYLLILALAKTVTPGGSAPRERGQQAGFCPAALAAKPGR